MQINQVRVNNGQCVIEEIHEDNPLNNILLAIAQQSLIKDQKLEEKNQKYNTQIQLVVKENESLKNENLLLKENITVLESRLSDLMKLFQIEKEELNKTICEKEKQNLELEQKFKPYIEHDEKYQTLKQKITEVKKELLEIESEFNKTASGFPLSELITWPWHINGGLMLFYKSQHNQKYQLVIKFIEKQTLLANYEKTLSSMGQIKK